MGEVVKAGVRAAEERAGARPTGVAGVVVPTHNDGANIEPLLARLLEEPDVAQVVVVASGCRDGTVATASAVIARHPDKVRLYVERERSGKVSAVNFGLAQLTTPVVVVVSGDVLPERGAIAKVVRALGEPGVGLAGGRPVPVNPSTDAIGHAAHLLWRLHHRLALHQPKLGEMIALRAEALVSLPTTSVDEACFQALLEGAGWRSVYVADAVVWNRGPGTKADFVSQRRQVHTGHLWLRRRQHYAVPSLRLALLGTELWNDVRTEPGGLRPTQLAWTVAAVAMEAWARLLARVDYLQGKENHVWAMVESTKAPAAGADGLGVRHR
ncbi:MAG: glycosyltransferase family 2 protein [Actinomycetota bacterium]|nr:glycosyltransferase family 2 protein [Actinomycetota bacterium]